MKCAELEQLCSMLEGTCMSLEEACQKLMDKGEDALSPEDVEYIEERIARCEECSWWNLIEEMDEDDDQLCNVCAERHT